ncbi:hypothetical protein ACRYCC_31885 [Actinomadura scrupuli]|uniref:hypothetical protein n=1 Tax=Actinomadura scrupuli TaxID=559629 RepID=UPI003D95C824
MRVSTWGRLTRGLAAFVLIAAATAAGYLGWLGWDQHKDPLPGGGVSGPYQAWQVLGLVATLCAVAVAAGRRGHPVAAVLGMTLTMTLCFSVDAAGDADGDGLWPVGAALVAIGTFTGISLVAALAWALRPRPPRPAGQN